MRVGFLAVLNSSCTTKIRVLLDNNVMEVVLPNKLLEFKPSHVSHLEQGFRGLIFAAAGHSSGPFL